VFNPADVEFDGLVAHVPLGPSHRLLDEQDQPVSYQVVDHRSLLTTASLFALKVPADGYRVLHVAPAPNQDGVAAAGGFSVEPGTLANGLVSLQANTRAVTVGGWEAALEVRRDTTDTWSHSVDRFSGRKLGRVNFADGWKPKELGPIRASLLGLGTFANSRVWVQLQQVAGQPLVRLKLALVWAQVQQILQLRLQAPGPVARHVDLVAGGPLVRQPDGVERPVNGGLIVETGAGRLGIVAPELFSLSVDRRGASLTLIRSPYICHHDPMPFRRDQPATDQGQHLIDIDLYPDFEGDSARLVNLARQALMPPFVWDLTG
jgi:hypothetical protein